jgi:hypothetical protein
MDVLLLTASLLTVVVGFAHSILGERYIIRRLLRRDDLPRLFGNDTFTCQTLRFAWHLTTVAWWGLAAVLALLSGAVTAVPVAQGVLLAVALTFGVSAALAIVFTRARHLSWIVFLAIAALAVVAAS